MKSLTLFITLSMVTCLVTTVVPDTARAAERHLFYLHGCCIKGQDDPKVKAYETIVSDLKKSGFNVKYELRTADVGDNDAAVQAHAAKIAGEGQGMLSKGTSPGDITVVGYSLGSMTALVASGLIANPKINIVLLAGCPINPAIKVNIDFAKVQGRVMSIYDTKDVKFGSCQGRLPPDITFQEVVLNSGEGHAVFKMPDDQHVKLWMDPLLSWVGDVRRKAASASR